MRMIDGDSWFTLNSSTEPSLPTGVFFDIKTLSKYVQSPAIDVR